MNVLGIAVVDNHQRFSIEIGGKLAAAVGVLVVGIQSVARSTGRERNKSEFFRFRGIRNVIERYTGLRLFVGRRLRRIVAQVVVVVEYQNLLFTIDAQI